MTVLSGLDADPQWSVRAALATRAGHARAASARTPRLTQMLDDSDQRVVPAVLDGARRDRAPDAEAVLIETLTADDPVVRQAAANGLARLKATKASAALRAGLRHRGEGSDLRGARGDSRARSSSSIGASGAAAARARADDRDWAMRVRAATLLRTLDAAADLTPDAAGAGGGAGRAERSAAAHQSHRCRRWPTSTPRRG